MSIDVHYRRKIGEKRKRNRVESVAILRHVVDDTSIEKCQCAGSSALAYLVGNERIGACVWIANNRVDENLVVVSNHLLPVCNVAVITGLQTKL